jgi:hypothetical protein
VYVEEALFITTTSTIDKNNGAHRFGKSCGEEQEEEETMTSHVKALTLATLTPKLHVNILHNVQTN